MNGAAKAIKSGGAGSGKAAAECLLTAAECAEVVAPPLAFAMSLRGGLQCLDGLINCFKNPAGGGEQQAARVVIGVAESDPVVTFWPAILNHIAIMEDFLGTNRTVWFNAQSGAYTDEWFGRFRLASVTNSEWGRMISTTERADLLASNLPPSVATAEINRFLDRWNLTQTNWDANILSPAEAPPGANTNFMNYRLLEDRLVRASDFHALAQDAGFRDPIDAVVTPIKNFLASELGKTRGVCTSVRVRIDQEAVLTREAFRATLEFENGESAPLTNVVVTLNILDGQGFEATNFFAVPAPELVNLSAINGTGALGTGQVATVRWTMVPTVEAAPTTPVRYYVGGRLQYKLNGLDVDIPLQPAGITVHPTARLELKYFHQRDVFSDDPFTDIVEPAVPYSLAVMVQNKGAGTAKDFRITSAQPKIVDNEKGLVIDFKIIATEVAGQGLTPSLTADFGDVAPGTNLIARWLLTSSLQGLFTDYDAKFEHLDDLGNEKLSLLDAVSIHEMIHVVSAGGPFADGKPDFLVNDQPDPLSLPDTIYLSNGSTGSVSVVAAGNITGTVSPGNLSVQLDAQMPGGWTYLRVPDPGNGQYRLASVTRSDNTVIPVDANVWLTDRTFIGMGKKPLDADMLHLLDYNSTGSYTLTYAPNAPADNTPPASAVAALPAQSSTGIPLSWSGADNTGVAGYDIYVSENGGAFARWLVNATATSAIYQGNFGSTYAFYSIAVDQAGNREAAPGTPDAQTTVTQTNHPPVLTAITNRTIFEGQTLSVPLTVVDADADEITLSVGVGSPAGVTVNSPARLLTWVTGEAQGPSTNVLSVVARDNGIPQLSVTQVFTVIVVETNSPPTVEPIANKSVAEGKLLSFTAVATDSDLPLQSLTFSLIGAPLGANIHPFNGQFTWTPTDTQGGVTNVIKVVVTDNGPGALSATQAVSVIVLDTQPDFRVDIGSTQLLATASADVPFLLQSGLDLTNVQWVLAMDNDRLENLTLQNLAAQVGAAELSPLSSNRYFARFASQSGAVLQGNLLLARAVFGTGTNTHSAIVRVEVESLTGARGSSTAPVNSAGGFGRVFVVGREPILDARITTGQFRLTVLGEVGSGYELGYSTNLMQSNWPVVLGGTQTNLAQDVSIPTTLPRAFYRVIRTNAP